jgi:hypothetical protein
VIKKTNLDPQAAFNEALRDWRIASAEVDAQLTAYFGADRAGRALTERWRHFKVAVDGMYFLSGTGLKGARCRMIREVTIVLESRRTRCTAGALERETYQERMCLAKKATMYVRLAACDSDNADVYGYRRDGRFSSVYEELSGRLLGRSRSLVKELVGLNPSGF